MNSEIQVFEEFFSRETCAAMLRMLFDRRALWENRQDRTLPYRNGNWFTLGASMYLDLKSQDTFPAYVQKLDYFNRVLGQVFKDFHLSFQRVFRDRCILGPDSRLIMLADIYPYASYPGFHIFAPEETLQMPFAKDHVDKQWEAFAHMPGFPFPLAELKHFSFTLPLALPYQGGGMAIPSEFEGEPDHAYMYLEGNLYKHSGQFRHLVLPFKGPVTPLDWRITYQGHGFYHNDTAYLYW